MDDRQHLDALANILRNKCADRGERPRTIVITGASSGIGLSAAKLLARINPRNRIILVARTDTKARQAKAQVLADVQDLRVLPDSNNDGNNTDGENASSGLLENIIPMECDHCSLESVRRFSSQLRRQLEESSSDFVSSDSDDNSSDDMSASLLDPSSCRTQRTGLIDALCLNAAVLMPKDETEASFTEDGMEVTFETNHLAPFLIANLTHDLLRPGSGRIIVSTSGLHIGPKLGFDGVSDGVSYDGTQQPRKGFAMMDGSDYNFKAAYALSKLCNVAVCAELHERLHPSPRGVIVNCFSPGLMTTSGLWRHQRLNARPISSVVSNSQQALSKERTVAWGGGSLVYMAIADETALRGGQYWEDARTTRGDASVYGRDFVPSPHLCQEALDLRKRRKLWDISCSLAGIPKDLVVLSSSIVREDESDVRLVCY